MNNKNKAESRHGYLSLSPLSLCPCLLPLTLILLIIKKCFIYWLRRYQPTKKMGNLQVPQIHLKKVQSAGFFYVKGRGKQEWQEVVDYRRHLGASRGRTKVVLSLLTLDDVSLVNSCKSLLHNTYFPHLPRNCGLFCKTQAKSRISLMISMFMCKTKQTLLNKGVVESERWNISQFPPFCCSFLSLEENRATGSRFNWEGGLALRWNQICLFIVSLLSGSYYLTCLPLPQESLHLREGILGV